MPRRVLHSKPRHRRDRRSSRCSGHRPSPGRSRTQSQDRERKLPKPQEEVVKEPCDKCGKLATWMFAPADFSGADAERFLCSKCIDRGCSCNIINQDTLEEMRDEFGHLLPCCEYDHCDDGFQRIGMVRRVMCWIGMHDWLHDEEPLCVWCGAPDKVWR